MSIEKEDKVPPPFHMIDVHKAFIFGDPLRFSFCDCSSFIHRQAFGHTGNVPLMANEIPANLKSTTLSLSLSLLHL